jgi:hypothetical protein
MHKIINLGNIKQRAHAEDLGVRQENTKIVLKKYNLLAGCCEYGNKPLKTVNFLII